MAEADDSEIPELTEEHFARAIHASVRKRLIAGDIRSGSEITALRCFVGLGEEEFAVALGVGVGEVRSWERDESRPGWQVLLCLRRIARSPSMIRTQ